MLGGYSRIIVPFVVYVAMFVAMYLSFTDKKKWAFMIALPLFCLPNVRMRLAEYPFGKDFIDIIYVCLLFGMVAKGEFFLNARRSMAILFYIIMLSFSFFIVGDRFGSPIVAKHLADYKNYIMIPIGYFFAYNILRTKDSIKLATVILVLTFIAMNRSTYGEYGLGLHSNFVSEQRPGGVFGADGLGSNHLGAFMAQYTMILIGICGYVGRRLLLWGKNVVYLFWFAIIANFYSLIFSFSRGAWLGGLVGLLFLGLVKTRKIIVLILLIPLFGQYVLPESVYQRIEMTEREGVVTEERYDDATLHRMAIWKHSIKVFEEYPVVGVGLYNFRFFEGDQLWTSTHNQFLAFLCETGMLGFSLYLLLYLLAFKSGWYLTKVSEDNFFKGLGLGFCGCVIASMVANIFGDRWTFFSLQSLYFVFWAMVERAISITRQEDIQPSMTKVKVVAEGE